MVLGKAHCTCKWYLENQLDLGNGTWNALVLHLLVVGEVATTASPLHHVVSAHPLSCTEAVYQTVGFGVGNDAVPPAVPASLLAAVAKEVPVDAYLVAGTTVKVEDIPVTFTDHVLRKACFLTCKQ